MIEEIEAEEKENAWVEVVLAAISSTDGVDSCHSSKDENGKAIIHLTVEREDLSFVACSDGKEHGVDLDGAIHDMTSGYNIQWWIVGELYIRLKRARATIETLEEEIKTLRQ